MEIFALKIDQKGAIIYAKESFLRIIDILGGTYGTEQPRNGNTNCD